MKALFAIFLEVEFDVAGSLEAPWSIRKQLDVGWSSAVVVETGAYRNLLLRARHAREMAATFFFTRSMALSNSAVTSNPALPLGCSNSSRTGGGGPAAPLLASIVG